LREFIDDFLDDVGPIRSDRQMEQRLSRFSRGQKAGGMSRNRHSLQEFFPRHFPQAQSIQQRAPNLDFLIPIGVIVFLGKRWGRKWRYRRMFQAAPLGLGNRIIVDPRFFSKENEKILPRIKKKNNRMAG